MQDAFSLRWRDDQREVLICEVMNWSTWEETDALLDGIREMVAHAKTTTHFIIHFSQNSIPQMWALHNLYRLMNARETCPGHVVFVKSPNHLRTFMRMAQQIYGLWADESAYVFVGSLSEALEHLRQHAHLSLQRITGEFTPPFLEQGQSPTPSMPTD
ncbi:MAG: hypothetical protein ACOYLB_06875 [Phototrophicaceae bacterium]